MGLPIRLADRVSGRDNNLTPVRLIAAFTVLYTHASIAFCDDNLDILGRCLGVNMSKIAVDAFFFISGLLICRSVTRSQDMAIFIQSRILRVYPALIVCVFATVITFGAALSTLSLPDYITSCETWLFVASNCTLVFGVSYQLPGISLSHINGSLWTLPWELLMYACIASLYCTFRERRHWFSAIVLMVAGVLLVGIFLDQNLKLGWNILYSPASRFTMFFFLGAAFYVLRELIPLSRFAGFVAFLGLLSLGLIGLPPWAMFYPLLFTYSLVCLAYTTRPFSFPPWCEDFSTAYTFTTCQ